MTNLKCIFGVRASLVVDCGEAPNTVQDLANIEALKKVIANTDSKSDDIERLDSVMNTIQTAKGMPQAD